MFLKKFFYLSLKKMTAFIFLEKDLILMRPLLNKALTNSLVANLYFY